MVLSPFSVAGTVGHVIDGTLLQLVETRLQHATNKKTTMLCISHVNNNMLSPLTSFTFQHSTPLVKQTGARNDWLALT